MFGAVKLTKHANFDKTKYSGYGIGFDAHGSFCTSAFDAYGVSDSSRFGKNVAIFGGDMSLSGHVDNRKKVS